MTVIITGADLPHYFSAPLFILSPNSPYSVAQTALLCWLRSAFPEFSWSGTGSLECYFLARAGCLDPGERAGWVGSWLSSAAFSLLMGGNTTCQNTALDCPGFLLYRWGLESLWTSSHGSKPRLLLAEPGIIQELVFFFFILSTNQSVANSVSNFWTRCHE